MTLSIFIFKCSQQRKVWHQSGTKPKIFVYLNLNDFFYLNCIKYFPFTIYLNRMSFFLRKQDNQVVNFLGKLHAMHFFFFSRYLLLVFLSILYYFLSLFKIVLFIYDVFSVYFSEFLSDFLSYHFKLNKAKLETIFLKSQN